jgi:cytochrome c oxidase subunit 2
VKVRYNVLTLTAVAVLLLTISSLSPRLATAQASPKRIEVFVKRFAFTPGEITLKKGEPVILSFTSSDVTHGISFKELNLKTKIVKGTSSQLSFTPTQTGDFVGHCSTFCGSGHGSMMLTLHIVD